MPTFSVNYEAAYRKACEDFRAIDPHVAAGNTDTTYETGASGSGQFYVRYFNTDFMIEFPKAAIPFYLSLEDVDAVGRDICARLIGQV